LRVINALLVWAPGLLVAALAAAGAAAVLSRAAGARLPLALVLPVGLAATCALAALAAWVGLPGAAVVAVIAVLCVAGLLDLAPRIRGADPLGVAVVGLTLLVYLLAIATTGQATVGGYTTIGDPVIHLVGADQLLGSASRFAEQDGAFRTFFETYYENGYPAAGAALLGALSATTGQDPIHLLHPLISLAMAGTASAVWALLTPIVEHRVLRAGGALLAAFPQLTFNFAITASLKEMLAITFLAATAAAVVPVLRSDDPPTVRRLLPAAISAAATLGVVGVAGGIFLAPLALVVAVPLLRQQPVRRLATVIAPAILATVVLAAPTFVGLREYLEVSAVSLTTQTELGNLSGSLPLRQALGVWLGPDFRSSAQHWQSTRALGTLAGLLALVGLAALALRAARSRAAVPLLGWVLGTAIGAWITIDRGSPWADAKALVILGPAILALTGVGAAALPRFGRPPIAGLLVLLAVGAGVGGSAALAAREVGPVPSARYDELASINERFAGQGPMGVAEFEEYVRHVLRDVPVKLANDPFGGLVTGGTFGVTSDMDELELGGVESMRLLLVRPGGGASRPPSNFVRKWSGRYYEVWGRDDRLPVPRARLLLGTADTGGQAQPTCQQVRELTAGVAAGEELVVASRPVASSVPLRETELPVGWSVDPRDERLVRPYGGGRLELTLRGPAPNVPVAVWSEISASRTVTVTANGVRSELGPQELNPYASPTRLTTVRTDARGDVRLTLERPRKQPRAGWGNRRDRWGPVTVTVPDPLGVTTVRRVDPDDARALCRQTLDWIEIAPTR
ncbi:MAG: hypothetical protein JHD16_14485, partial [Solirubrobacteraceae bacterium]|nr:hypothetical protein [Solirubrobacteraceae bacterium]